MRCIDVLGSETKRCVDVPRAFRCQVGTEVERLVVHEVLSVGLQCYVTTEIVPTHEGFAQLMLTT